MAESCAGAGGPPRSTGSQRCSCSALGSQLAGTVAAQWVGQKHRQRPNSWRRKEPGWNSLNAAVKALWKWAVEIRKIRWEFFMACQCFTQKDISISMEGLTTATATQGACFPPTAWAATSYLPISVVLAS